jgi:hypothetical protein
MNDKRDSMKTFCLGTDAERSENVVAVGPGSLKAQPPIAMYTFKLGSFCFRSIKRLYKLTSLGEEGAILNVVGSIIAKAKLICV